MKFYNNPNFKTSHSCMISAAPLCQQINYEEETVFPMLGILGAITSTCAPAGHIKLPERLVRFGLFPGTFWTISRLQHKTMNKKSDNFLIFLTVYIDIFQKMVFIINKCLQFGQKGTIWRLVNFFFEISTLFFKKYVLRINFKAISIGCGIVSCVDLRVLSARIVFDNDRIEMA